MAILLGCGPPSGQSSHGKEGVSSPPAAPKRVVAAIMGDGNTLYANVNSGVGGVPGLDALQELANAGLGLIDSERKLIPQLAEQVPSLENGLWRVYADGTMETTWQIREGARWHDGTPFTSADLVFSATVLQDVEIPNFQHTYFRALAGLDALDTRTVTARWRQTFINADALFTREVGYPLPRHLLEQPYLEDKARFLQLPHWNEGFVGAGPFKLRQFVRGSHLVLDANPDYVMGRPKVDVIEVRFIPDSSTLAANILAGEVEVTIGRTLSIEQAIQVRDQWRAGSMLVAPYALTRIYSQFMNPNPAILLNVQFRRALLHAIDRQTMVDTLESGLTEVAHSVLPPGRPEFREIEAGITRYAYEPRITASIVESLGYARGADGSWRESDGTPLALEIRATGGQDILEKPVLLAADAWRAIGLGVDPLFVPPQRNQDREYRANRPGLLLAGGTSDLQMLDHLVSSEVPLAERNYVGRNDSRYANPEYDTLYGRYLVTIPQNERRQMLRQIIHHLADNLPMLGLYYRVEPTLVAKRVQHVEARQRNSMQVWNAHLWEVVLSPPPRAGEG